MSNTRSAAPLQQLMPTLPSSWYYEPAHYRRELEAFHYQSWLYACRSEALPAAGDFITVTIGDQNLLLVRDAAGHVNAFHNTCRHRGSILCDAERGHLRGERIACPYHAWTYSLEGELLHTPFRLPSDDFDPANFPLYRVGAGEWGGFVFVNLGARDDSGLADALGDMPVRFHNWRLQDLRVGHRISIELECNWKVFWENFQECYHCPSVHPELCQVVPIYGRGILSPSDDPGWRPRSGEAPGAEPRLAAGAVTWSMDGRTPMPSIEGLAPAEQQAGHTFGVMVPGYYVVAHLDYARAARLLPRGPERTELALEWLFPEATLARPDFDVERAVEFGRLVVEQDGRACELNQRGLRSRRHQQGVLVPQEYYVREFHQWLRQGLGEAA